MKSFYSKELPNEIHDILNKQLKATNVEYTYERTAAGWLKEFEELGLGSKDLKRCKELLLSLDENKAKNNRINYLMNAISSLFEEVICLAPSDKIPVIQKNTKEWLGKIKADIEGKNGK
jgi:hypothetical protein